MPQRRARPASAQPSSRAPAAPSPASGGGVSSASRRQSYRARRLPPPWDDNSSAGCSTGSSGAGGGCRSAGRRRGRAVASTPAEALNFAGGVRNGRDWDDCGALGLGPGARRAVAAKAAAAATAASEVRSPPELGSLCRWREAAAENPPRLVPFQKLFALLVRACRSRQSLGPDGGWGCLSARSVVTISPSVETNTHEVRLFCFCWVWRMEAE